MRIRSLHHGTKSAVHGKTVGHSALGYLVANETAKGLLSFLPFERSGYRILSYIHIKMICKKMQCFIWIIYILKCLCKGVSAFPSSAFQSGGTICNARRLIPVACMLRFLVGSARHPSRASFPWQTPLTISRFYANLFFVVLLKKSRKLASSSCRQSVYGAWRP